MTNKNMSRFVAYVKKKIVSLQRIFVYFAQNKDILIV